MSVESSRILKARALEDGSGWQLLSPTVGEYLQAPEVGGRYLAGQTIARLRVLGRTLHLKVPDGVGGFVTSVPGGDDLRPVAYGGVLLELQRSQESSVMDEVQTAAAEADAGGPVVCAQQAGRFFRRPDPGSPPFAEAGDELRAGRSFGLLEVMKTFNPVKYDPGERLPDPARIVRFLAEDGQEVEEGQPLLELSEPA